MVRVAVRAPVMVGANCTVKVVVPVGLDTGDDGWVATVKSASPLTATLGVPVRFRSAVPILEMVKVRLVL